jgi:hypothetical protein
MGEHTVAGWLLLLRRSSGDYDEAAAAAEGHSRGWNGLETGGMRIYVILSWLIWIC